MAKTIITKLTMQGFKSFNKRVSIPFLNGVNIIAGPNGSGKSNVIDAVVFVLGRTSAKSLRADRLHELIFHGGEGKSAAEYASVTLFLDNSGKIFPFDNPEISVVRKVNRKGMSVYRLNGKNVTREKLLETLALARIFPEERNIVLQGDVTQVIEMNSIERRIIIDEISGIADYNDKKEKSQQDLEAVDSKLKEAEIIINQRYDIYKKLEDEKNATIRFETLQKQLQTLKASHAHKKFTTLEEQLKKLSNNVLEKEEQKKKTDNDLEQTENNLEEKEKSIREIAGKIVDLSKSFKIEKEISEVRSELLIKKDKINANTREIERLSSMIEKLEGLSARKAEFTEIPRSVQAVLRLGLKGVYGTVVNLISVPEKYQVAIEVTAGPHLYDIVVDNENTASYCIDYLKRERVGRATFLPLSKIKPTTFSDSSLLGKSGAIGLASKLIKFDTKFLSAIEFVFGNTLIVENLDAAKSLGIGKARMVTLDGDLTERSGAMIGGYYFKTAAKQIESSTSQEISRYSQMKESLQNEVSVLQTDVKELEVKLKELATSESLKEFVDLEKTRVSSEHEVDELRERRKRLQERKLNLEIEVNRLNIEKAKIETEFEIAKQEFEKFGQAEYIDEKLQVLETQIIKAEKELTEIGSVNLKAVDEFEKMRTEFDQYKQRYEKILEEKKAVLEMINQIEQKRKEVFGKTLGEISQKFDKIFTNMAGGFASLNLENPDDIESGLLIQATPKGKRLLNIDSMSGGEKTVVALAFLFAIQMYKPAPFYMFDEVDAALDKENTRKIGEWIKRMSKEAQFIVITHNDQTIQYGDRVYGVTMDRGESKIIGVEMPKE